MPQLLQYSGSNATQWAANYIMQDDNTEGALTFSIAFQDLAANPGDTVEIVTDGSEVIFDKTATDVSNFSIAWIQILIQGNLIMITLTILRPLLTFLVSHPVLRAREH